MLGEPPSCQRLYAWCDGEVEREPTDGLLFSSIAMEWRRKVSEGTPLLGARSHLTEEEPLLDFTSSSSSSFSSVEEAEPSMREGKDEEDAAAPGTYVYSQLLNNSTAAPLHSSVCPAAHTPAPVAMDDNALLAEAMWWCPWSSLDEAPTTLEGWGLPSCVVAQWELAGVVRLHPWQRTCLYEFFAHISQGLRRCYVQQQQSYNIGTAMDEVEGTVEEVEAQDGVGRKREREVVLVSDDPPRPLLSLPTRHLLYSAPTSGGKALISDVLAIRALLTASTPITATTQHSRLSSMSRGGSCNGSSSSPVLSSRDRRRLVIYALPFVVLAEERSRALESLLQPLHNVHVRCLAGGTPLLDELHSAAATANIIYVCTNEKAHSLWRELEARQRLSEVAAVVVDEVHYIEDGVRGVVLELFLSSVLRYVRSQQPYDSSATTISDDAFHVFSSSLQLFISSATIHNAPTLAQWCGEAFLFLTDHRPIPLHLFSVVNGVVCDELQHPVRTLTDLTDEVSKEEEGAAWQALQVKWRSTLPIQPRHRRNTAAEEWVVDRLAMEVRLSPGKRQVLVFNPTRRETERTARRLASAWACYDYRHRPSPFPTGGDTTDACTSSPLVLTDSPGEVKAALTFTSFYGVGFHHAGVGSADRLEVEKAYREGRLWVISCTTTLSTGVNFPCSRVIFAGPRVGLQPLDAMTFRQAAGRSGRTGFDPYGEAFVVGKPSDAALLRRLICGSLPPVESNFSPQRRGVGRVLLDGMESAAEKRVSPADLHHLLHGTLYAVQAWERQQATTTTFSPLSSVTLTVEMLEATRDALRMLEVNHFIQFDSNDGVFTLTPLGDATAASLFDPTEALTVLNELERSIVNLCVADDLHLLYHCTPLQHDLEPDWQVFYHYIAPQFLFGSPTAARVAEVVGVSEATLAAFAMSPPPRARQSNTTTAQHPKAACCRRLYGAMVLAALVKEESPEAVRTRFLPNGSPGDILKFMDAAALFTGSLSRFAHALHWWFLPPLLNVMAVRLRRGVESDLLPLMEIEGLTAWRARELYSKGYRTPRSLVGASAEELEAILKRHSLHGFHGQPLSSDVGDGEGGKNAVHHMVVRLQQQARVVLQREMRELETVLHPEGVFPARYHIGGSSATVVTQATTITTQSSSRPSVSQSNEAAVYPTWSDVLAGKGRKTKGMMIVVCASDPEQVQRFQQHLDELLRHWSRRHSSHPAQRLDTVKLENRSSVVPLPNVVVAIRAISQPAPTRVARANDIRRGQQRRGFTLLLSVCQTMLDGECGTYVTFILHQCPTWQRAGESSGGLPPQPAVVAWWATWRPPCLVVWLGVQHQSRFFASVGWMPRDHLFRGVPHHRRKRNILLDPLIMLWMAYPEVDMSVVMGKEKTVDIVMEILSHVPCVAAQVCLQHAHRPLSASPRTHMDGTNNIVLSVNALQGDSSKARISPAALAHACSPQCHQECMCLLASVSLSMSLLPRLYDEGLFASYVEREVWIALVCAQMEMSGVGFDPTLYPPLMASMKAKVSSLVQYAYDVVGRSNWSLSSPQECAVALYDDMRLPCLHFLGDIGGLHHEPLPRRRRLLRENRSTRASVLVQLSRIYPSIPLPGILMEYRRLSGWAEKYMEPMLHYATQRKQKKHCRSGVCWYSIHVGMYPTATGRLVMAEPNLQTLPHPVRFELEGAVVDINLRCALIPSQWRGIDNAEKIIFLSADYSHIEARLLAHYSGDDALLNAFPSASSPQQDIFKELAADLFHPRGDDEVKPLAIVTPEERRIAKALWYGTMYGRGKHSIANELSMTVEEAEGFRVQLRKKYASTIRCVEKMAAEARRQGFVTSLLGRRRWIPRTARSASGRQHTTSAMEDEGSGDLMGRNWDCFERMAINTLCQSSAADILREAMVRIFRDPLFQSHFVDGQEIPPVARLVLQIHDELLVEVKESEKEIVMSTLAQHMDLTQQLQLRVPLRINFQHGTSWGEMKPIQR